MSRFTKGVGGVQDIFRESVNYDFDSVKRCAIVANSGKILNHEYGSEIDSHDCVVRFNAAPTQGYEKHVGTQTDFRVLNGPIMIGGSVSYVTTPRNWISTLENEKLILLPHRLKDKPRNYRKAENLAGEKNELIRLSDFFSKWILRKTRKNHISKPSTGLKAIHIFMNIATDCVNLYGFGFHRERNLEKRHYWEDFSHNSTGGHRWVKENSYVQILCNKYNVNLKEL